MPGIYIDPASGSAITSTLGNILGGLATNMDPKTQAEAQELRERVMQENLNNQILRGRIAGASGIPGVLAAGNADPTALPGASGTVAGTTAALSQPPDAGPAPGTFGGSTVNAGFNPYAKVLAGSYLNDPSMSNFQTGINLGKDMTTGPGTDFPTQNQIITSQSTPQHVAPGDTLVIDPRKGNAPGNLIVGGDAAAAQAEQKQRGIDIDDAKNASDLGALAKQNLVELQHLQQIYDAIVNTPGTTDIRSVIGEQGIQFLKDHTGIDISGIVPSVGAKQAIASRLQSMFGSTVSSIQGDTPMKAAAAAAFHTLPDPTRMDPNQFRGAVGQLRRVLQAQAAESEPANKFRNSHFTKEDADAYHRELQAIQEANNKNFAAQPEPGAAGEGGPAAGPAAPAPPAGPPAASGAPPSPAAVAHLRAHPELAPAFDAKYGAGSSKRVLGQ